MFATSPQRFIPLQIKYRAEIYLLNEHNYMYTLNYKRKKNAYLPSPDPRIHFKKLNIIFLRSRENSVNTRKGDAVVVFRGS